MQDMMTIQKTILAISWKCLQEVNCVTHQTVSFRNALCTLYIVAKKEFHLHVGKSASEILQWEVLLGRKPKLWKYKEHIQ